MKWSLDAEGAVAHVSKDWRKYFGIQEDEIVGASSRVYVHPEDRPAISSIMSHAVHLREPFLICFRQRRANDDYVWVMAGAAPSFSPFDGNLLGYLGNTEVLTRAPTPPAALDILHRMPDRSRHRVVMLDAMADHVTTARNIAKHTDDIALKKILDYALVSIGDLLYKAIRR